MDLSLEFEDYVAEERAIEEVLLVVLHAIADLLVGEKIVEMRHEMRIGGAYPEDC